MSSQDNYRFQPHPEAEGLSWDDLFPPVGRAVSELLVCLEGATAGLPGEQSPSQHGQSPVPLGEVATTFLVYGDRGCGKTTVLLTARKAVEAARTGDLATVGLTGSPDSQRADLAEYVKRLSGRVEWLDLVNMEPLPPKTNLLTHLLVRVRSALHLPQQQGRSMSLFEEGAEDASALLDHLIGDASLLWEDVNEPDTRSRANRQRSAADTYTDFQARLKNAMAAVSCELAKRRGLGPASRIAIILPIDNIDRSAEHLYSIVKLAQLVSCRHLWLVLAGDQSDIDTFLERAYWKELGENATREGRATASGEEEALSIARRQAAAANHKLVPDGHRIGVGRVMPGNALFLKSKGQDRVLYSVLSQIPVTPEGSSHSWAPTTLLELVAPSLFAYLQGFALGSNDQKGRENFLKIAQRLPEMSQAGLQALALPARAVVDLCQIAQYEIAPSWDKTAKGKDVDSPPYPQPSADPDEAVVRIAKLMLYKAISESDLPNWAARRLHDNVIRRNNGGKTCMVADRGELFLDESAVHAVTLLAFGDDVAPVTISGWNESELHLRSHRCSRSDEPERPEDVELPSQVAGWFMLLHDILTYATEPLRRGSVGLDSHLRIVKTSHAISQDSREIAAEFWWPLPAWNAFLAYDVMEKQWNSFLSTIFQRFASEVREKPTEKAPLLRRLLALSWLSSICWTMDRWNANGPFEVPEKLDEPAIAKTEDSVLANLFSLWDAITDERIGLVFERNEPEQNKGVVLDWLLVGLPLFFLPELDTGLSLKSILARDEEERVKTLVDYWQQCANAVANARRDMIRDAIKGQGESDSAELERRVRVAAEYFDRLTISRYGNSDGQLDEQFEFTRLLPPAPSPPAPPPPQPEARVDGGRTRSRHRRRLSSRGASPEASP